MKKELTYLTFLLLLASRSYAQSLVLVEPQDINLLLEQDATDTQVVEDKNLNLSDVEELDDLEAIKADASSIQYEDAPSTFAQEPEVTPEKEEAAVSAPEGNEQVKVVNEKESAVSAKDNAKTEIFDAGDLEKQLLEQSKMVAGKMPIAEWQEITSSSHVDKYEVQEGDWLWKISKRLFGSGFYYSKVYGQVAIPYYPYP